MDDTIAPARERNVQIMRARMPRWVRNTVRNLATPDLYGDRVHSLSELKKAYYGRPAVVLGGGPSLDDALDHGAAEILRDRGDAVLLCPNSVTRAVLGRGIEPDHWLAMHPTPDIVESWRLSPADAPPRYMATAGQSLITSPTIAPRVLRYWLRRGGTVHFTMQGYTDEMTVVDRFDRGTGEAVLHKVQTHDMPGDWYGMVQHCLLNCAESEPELPLVPWQRRNPPQWLPELPNQGCVVNYGILTAVYLGCSPIMLLGVDFAFTPDDDGFPRWRSDDFRMRDGEWVRQPRDRAQDCMKVMTGRMYEAPSVRGRKIMSHQEMISYRNGCHAINDKQMNFDGLPIDLVNCSLGGIVVNPRRANIAEALWECETGTWRGRERTGTHG